MTITKRFDALCATTISATTFCGGTLSATSVIGQASLTATNMSASTISATTFSAVGVAFSDSRQGASACLCGGGGTISADRFLTINIAGKTYYLPAYASAANASA
jgi:TPP-dependent pyruvate/acetoin dehydrogenase alpha subunit